MRQTRYVWSHIGQFVGFALIGTALVALATTLEPGRPAAWARLVMVGTAASLTVAAALQAADGVALKALVDRWAAMGGANGPTFEAAFAARQIEIGLAAFLSLLSGLTLVILGAAMGQSARYPGWLGLIGLLDGLGMIAAGAAQASTGFSELAMLISMAASSVLLVWVILAGALLWRLAPCLGGGNGAAEDRQAPPNPWLDRTGSWCSSLALVWLHTRRDPPERRGTAVARAAGLP